MMDNMNEVVMPRMRDTVDAEGVDPNVGAALSIAASSMDQPRPFCHSLRETQASQKNIESELDAKLSE